MCIWKTTSSSIAKWARKAPMAHCSAAASRDLPECAAGVSGGASVLELCPRLPAVQVAAIGSSSRRSAPARQQRARRGTPPERSGLFPEPGALFREPVFREPVFREACFVNPGLMHIEESSRFLQLLQRRGIHFSYANFGLFRSLVRRLPRGKTVP